MVLPLVGGYAFAIIWKGSLYYASRESGHRLYFRAIFYAIFLSICAACIHIIIYASEWSHYRNFIQFVSSATGSQDSPVNLFDTPKQISLLSYTIVLGPILGFALNIPHSIDAVPWFRAWSNLVLNRAIMDNDFELLILRAVQRDRPVMFTMNDSKVYVGWVIRAPNPVESRKAVRILPLVSGFRDSETRVLEFTTDYLGLIDKISDDSPESPLNHLDLVDLEIVLPVECIVSSHPFDFEAYVLHFRPVDVDVDADSDPDAESTS